MMSFWRTLWITNNLRYAIAIADIQENQPAMVTTPIHPTSQSYLLFNISSC
jgi:hypothetical protein